MDTWMFVMWLALAALGYIVVIIGLAGLPMQARGRPRRIKWWGWVSMLALGFVAAALGLGWFLVIAVSLIWGTVTLFTRTAGSTPEDLDARSLLVQSRGGARAAIASASSEQLCALWHQTAQQMQHTYLPSTVGSYVELRQATLDELTARDPEGISRWLGDQPDGRDLWTYLHDQQA